MKAQILSFPMVGGKFCGNLQNFKKIAIECVKLCALCSTFSKLLKYGYFFLLQINFSPRSSWCTATNHTPCERTTHKLSPDVWFIARNFFESPEICYSLGPILKKIVIFLLNKKKQKLQNTLKLPQCQQIWQKVGWYHHLVYYFSELDHCMGSRFKIKFEFLLIAEK